MKTRRFYPLIRPSRMNFRRGMTLLEILLVFGLMSVLFGMIWGMIQLYSGHYLSSEKRVGRSQLVRSISQMLRDDLQSAVQDPIHPLRPDSGESGYVRRFGLRGDSTSLQIDVVQPNLFATTASIEENLAAAAGGARSQNPQVPELKTIFYEFIPVSARENDGASALEGNSTGATGESSFVGSLQTPTGTGGGMKLTGGTGKNSEEGGDFVRKFGLSRRELDFESPDESVADESKIEKTAAEGESLGADGSEMIGSLSAPPESSFSTPNDENAELLTGLEDKPAARPRELTAAQLSMEIDEGTMWAPEVVDCQFRYFDGADWFDSWNSIQRNGLPVAIEVDLKLLPLDDVEVLRSSPYLFQLSLSANAGSGTNQNGGGEGDSGTVIGSLSTVPGEVSPENRPMTLEEAVEALGLSSVMVRRVTAYLPTTPLARHQVVERRHPVEMKEGPIRRRQAGGPGVKKVKAEPNRYLQDRTAPERKAEGRSADVRLAGERKAERRTASDRMPLDNRVTERTTVPSPPSQRTSEKRTAEKRTASKREPPKRTAPNRAERTEAVQETPTAIEDPYSKPEAPAFDPAFAGVGNAELGPTPLAAPDAAFDSIDALMGGFEPATPKTPGQAGRVPKSGGKPVPTQTRTSADQKGGTHQTWIRGR